MSDLVRIKVELTLTIHEDCPLEHIRFINQELGKIFPGAIRKTNLSIIGEQYSPAALEIEVEFNKPMLILHTQLNKVMGIKYVIGYYIGG